MDPNWNNFRRDYQEFLEDFNEYVMHWFSAVLHNDAVTMKDLMRHLVPTFQLAFNDIYRRNIGINSERQRDSISTRPSPGTSDAAPGISHSSDDLYLDLDPSDENGLGSLIARAQRPDGGVPEWATRQIPPGYSREMPPIMDSWLSFRQNLRQERLNSAGGGACDRAEDVARGCGREISSERWGGHIQTIQSAADGPGSSSLRPESRPPPEMSLSSVLSIDSNDFASPEQTAESHEHSGRRGEPMTALGTWEEALREVTATWERLRRYRQVDRLARQIIDEAARLADSQPGPSQPRPSQPGPSQPGPSGLHRSPGRMAQKRKVQSPKGLSESSNPKARRERDSDTSDSSD